MPKKIDHEERKEHILKTALDVFAREGYRDSNLSLIAERAGLSRPTIYQYFHDKEEIYYYAVKLVTGRLFAKYSEIAWGDGKDDEIARMKAILKDIINEAIANEDALMNLMAVMLSAKKDGVDFADVIQHRTAKLSILFKRLIRQGVSNGTIKPVDIARAASELFAIAETICFQVAFFRSFSREEAYEFASAYIEGLRA